MELSNKNVIKMLCKFNKCEPTDLAKAIRSNYLDNINFIKSGVLKTNHLKYNIIICPDFITNRNAKELFSFRGFKNITVDQYFFIKHKLNLQYSYLPCLAIKGGGNHKSYYPLEVIEFFDIDELKIS